MTWLKIDDGFVDHPKVIGLKDRAFRVHVSALCWAARFPAERGRIPKAVLRQIGATPAIVAELISSALWDEMEDGIYLHDFTEYNPPPPAGLSERRAEAGRRGGLASAQQRASKREANAQATAKQLAWQANQPPSPSRPLPLHESSNEASCVTHDEAAIGRVFKAAEHLVGGTLNRLQYDVLAEKCAERDPSWVLAAIDTTRQAGKNSLAYAYRVLEGFGNDGPPAPRSSSNGNGTGRTLGGWPGPDTPREHIDSRTGRLLDPALIAANDELHRKLEERDRRREAAQRSTGDATASA